MAEYLISVEKNATLESIEKYYIQLYQAIGLDLIVDIFLPKTFSQSYFGLVPALLQFVITWNRYDNTGRLLLDLDETSDAAIDDLYKNEVIFPAVVLAWNTNGIHTAKGENLKGKLNNKNRQFMAKMLAGDSIAHKLLLTNFDHLSDNLQLPCFGNKYEFVGSEYQLLQNLRKGISDVFYLGQLLPEFVSLYPDIVAIIFELMKNTFEWGKEDEFNVPLETNIRGVFFKFFKKRRENLLKEYKGHEGLCAYFSSQELKENNQEELYFVEISVFDGGVGFARKYHALQDEPCHLSEIEILKTCLIKHVTSSKGLEKSDKGIGLSRILKVLNTKGFLIIRTGDLHVYRDLIRDPQSDYDEPGEMILKDWKTKTNKRYSKFKRSEGAVITIIYPLSINI